jgi:hypothetical protein
MPFRGLTELLRTLQCVSQKIKELGGIAQLIQLEFSKRFLLHSYAVSDTFRIESFALQTIILEQKTKLRALSSRANYTDRATAICRRS